MKFTLKSYLKTQMIKTIIGVMILSILIFSSAIKIIEKGYEKNLDTYADSMFLIAVTQITIGFGDIIPLAYLSKVVTIISCLIGVFFLALLVIAVNNIIDLSDKESEAYNNIKYLIDARAMHNLAANVIQKWWALIVMRRRKHPRFLSLLQYSICVKRFKIMRIQIKSKQNTVFTRGITELSYLSRTKVLEIGQALMPIDKYQKSMKILTRELSIKDKSDAIEKNCREMILVLSGSNNTEDLSRFKSANPRGSGVVNLTKFKKQKDKALKMMLMKLSQKTCSSSINIQEV